MDEAADTVSLKETRCGNTLHAVFSVLPSTVAAKIQAPLDNGFLKPKCKEVLYVATPAQRKRGGLVRLSLAIKLFFFLCLVMWLRNFAKSWSMAFAVT